MTTMAPEIWDKQKGILVTFGERENALSFSLVPVTKQNSCIIREDVDYHNPNHDHDKLNNKDNGHDKSSLIMADAYQVERK